jgi:GGDEF domain-containing protein
MLSSARAEAPDRCPVQLFVAAGAALVVLAALKLVTDDPTVDRAVNLGIDALMWVGAGLCLARVVMFSGERAPWTLMGVALAGSAAGDTLYGVLYSPGMPPVPSICDPFWLSFLVFGAASLVLLARARFLSADKGRLIESGQAALIVAAFGLILLFYPTLEEVADADGITVAFSLVYPIGDTVLMSTLIAALTLTGFRPGRAWLVLGGGLLLFSTCDAIRALQSIGAGYSATSFVEVGWAAAHLLIAYAAWMPPSYVRAVEKDDPRTTILPLAVSIVSIVIQVGALVGAFPGRYPAARTFIIVAQTLLLIRIVDTPNSYRRARSRDPITGLGNRYALAYDLDACVRGRAPRSLLLMCEVSEPRSLASGRGRSRRDALLVSLSTSLGDRVGHGARLYRDEEGDFLVLAPVALWESEERLIDATLDAFSAGADVALTVRYGAVLVPDEAADATLALALAEQRLDARTRSTVPPSPVAVP